MVGFRNNASYDRYWEARKIWGEVVNDSRTWATQVLSFVIPNHGGEPDEEKILKLRKELIYRQIAWAHALGFYLRRLEKWDALASFLNPKELTWLKDRKNKPAQLLRVQAERLGELSGERFFDSFRHIAMARTIGTLYDSQGKCERIKETPFPRQYAESSRILVWIFVLLMPFGFVQDFGWLTIPFGVLAGEAFVAMEAVGELTEHPFDFLDTDVPMFALGRTVEIDLREMLDESDLPAPLEPVHNVLL
jgi:putative membrane protein